MFHFCLFVFFKLPCPSSTPHPQKLIKVFLFPQNSSFVLTSNFKKQNKLFQSFVENYFRGSTALEEIRKKKKKKTKASPHFTRLNAFIYQLSKHPTENSVLPCPQAGFSPEVACCAVGFHTGRKLPPILKLLENSSKIPRIDPPQSRKGGGNSHFPVPDENQVSNYHSKKVCPNET